MASSGDVVFAKSYSQNTIATGSYATPIPYATTCTLAFNSTVNKYIVYMAGPATGVAIPTTFTLTGLPQSTVGSNTISGVATWTNKGSTAIPGTSPIFDYDISCYDITTGPALTTNVRLNMVSTLSPAFASGVGIIKIVVIITLD